MQLQLTKIWQLAATVEFEIGPVDSQLRFRVEAFQQAHCEGTYRMRVFRYDLFRLTPFADSARSSDEELLVADPTFDLCELEATSAYAATEMLIGQIANQLKL